MTITPDDPFFRMIRHSVKTALKENPRKPHKERAHSKLSASGAERWFNCPGSVELSEGIESKSSVYAIEGTHAHEVLEALMLIELSGNNGATIEENIGLLRQAPPEMYRHASHAANFMIDLHQRIKCSTLMVETRVYLDFIHPEMFGTFDGAVVDHFGTLHVFDFKYGQGVPVGPNQNLQMLFYGIGLAHQFQWNFKRVRLWVIQPRIKGYDGPIYWGLPILELKKWVETFRKAVDRVEKNPKHFVEGSWCHWCNAKGICPLKQDAKLERARTIFQFPPHEVER